MNEVIAGTDIGGTKIAVALENLNGEGYRIMQSLAEAAIERALRK